MKIRKLIFCLVLFFVFSQSSFSAENSEMSYDRIGKALATLYAESGNVSQENYDAFWNEIGAKDKADKEKIINFVKTNLLTMQDYQRETWRCAEIAWNSQKIPQCPNLQKKYDMLAAGLKKNKQEFQLKTIKDFSTKTIEAASKRGSLKPEGAVEIPLSLEMIQMMNKNLDSIFTRFEGVLKISY